MNVLSNLANAIFGRLSICALTGALIGICAGFFTGLLQGQHQNLVLSNAEVLQFGLILALITWLGVLLLVGIWLRYGVKNIAWPALINAILTCLLTVWACNQIQKSVLAVPIGLVIGILVGYLLCLWCRRRDSHRNVGIKGVHHG